MTPRWISSFFFSSRRRHTRWPRDWSSGVCSSDLGLGADVVAGREEMTGVEAHAQTLGPGGTLEQGAELAERAADRVPRPGGVLERDLHAIARGAGERLVER